MNDHEPPSYLLPLDYPLMCGKSLKDRRKIRSTLKNVRSVSNASNSFIPDVGLPVGVICCVRLFKKWNVRQPKSENKGDGYV